MPLLPFRGLLGLPRETVGGAKAPASLASLTCPLSLSLSLVLVLDAG
jgi:hypothetical protein